MGGRERRGSCTLHGKERWGSHIFGEERQLLYLGGRGGAVVIFMRRTGRDCCLLYEFALLWIYNAYRRPGVCSSTEEMEKSLSMPSSSWIIQIKEMWVKKNQWIEQKQNGAYPILVLKTADQTFVGVDFAHPQFPESGARLHPRASSLQTRSSNFVPVYLLIHAPWKSNRTTENSAFKTATRRRTLWIQCCALRKISGSPSGSQAF